MFEKKPIFEEAAAFVDSDSGTASRKVLIAAYACEMGDASSSWVFTGKIAMPNAEHLIPFLN